jgi:hypothetical protein
MSQTCQNTPKNPTLGQEHHVRRTYQQNGWLTRNALLMPICFKETCIISVHTPQRNCLHLYVQQRQHYALLS